MKLHYCPDTDSLPPSISISANWRQSLPRGNPPYRLKRSPAIGRYSITVIVAAVLLASGLQLRRVTESAAWRIVANAAITLGMGYVALLLPVMVVALSERNGRIDANACC